MTEWTKEELAAFAADFVVSAEPEPEPAAEHVPEGLVAPVRRANSQAAAWRPEYTELARRLCAQFGATDDDLAEFFGVSRRTIFNWYAKHQEFRDAVRLAKDLADDRVEMSLYRRAIGYTVDTEKIFLPKGSQVPVIVPTAEHVGPDTTACIFWLKNRRRGEWRDKVDHGIGGPNGGPVEVAATGSVAQQLTDSDWELIRSLAAGG